MKGKGEMHVNQATMVEAVQEYFSRTFRFDHAPKVTRVKRAPVQTQGAPDDFVIEFDADLPANENGEEESDD